MIRSPGAAERKAVAGRSDRDRVEVVVDPDRVVAELLGLPRDALHRGPLVLRHDVDEVESPTLWDECSELHVATLANSCRSVGAGHAPSMAPYAMRASKSDEAATP